MGRAAAALPRLHPRHPLLKARQQLVAVLAGGDEYGVTVVGARVDEGEAVWGGEGGGGQDLRLRQIHLEVQHGAARGLETRVASAGRGGCAQLSGLPRLAVRLLHVQVPHACDSNAQHSRSDCARDSAGCCGARTGRQHGEAGGG